MKLTQTQQYREYKLHIACLDHTRRCFPGLFHLHIPNRPGDATDGFFKKQMGAKAGASDLLFSWNCNHYDKGYTQENVTPLIGVIELKDKDGTLGSSQNRFLSTVNSLGWKTGVAKSVREFHAILKSWGLIPRSEQIVEPDLATHEEKLKRAYDFYKPPEDDETDHLIGANHD